VKENVMTNEIAGFGDLNFLPLVLLNELTIKFAEFKAKPTSLNPKIKPNETPKNECQEAASCKGSHLDECWRWEGGHSSSLELILLPSSRCSKEATCFPGHPISNP
jgi:hypothetical protein